MLLRVTRPNLQEIIGKCHIHSECHWHSFVPCILLPFIAVTVPMTALRYTPNEKFIVSAGLDGSLRVWTHLFKPVSACVSA